VGKYMMMMMNWWWWSESWSWS